MEALPTAVQAGIWGLLSGSSLVIGAAMAYLFRLPQGAVAGIMAFGSGVLISALSFDLMQEAFESGGFGSTAFGFLTGAVAFTAVNLVLIRQGAARRKHAGHGQRQAHEGGGLAIAAGALLDGIPEAVVIGVSLLAGDGVSVVAVAAVFLSNLPEGLSSAAGMRKAGRSKLYVFGVWGSIALASGVAAMTGAAALGGASPAVLAFTTALAAGAILAMLVDTMIPEAFEDAHGFTGLIAVLGFLAAFALSKLAGG